MNFNKNTNLSVLILCLCFSQYLMTSTQKESIFIERSGKQLGPFYRQNNSNIYLSGNNQAAGFSKTETKHIIEESIMHAMIRHQNQNYNVAIMINFKPHKHYSIDEYKIKIKPDDIV